MVEPQRAQDYLAGLSTPTIHSGFPRHPIVAALDLREGCSNVQGHSGTKSFPVPENSPPAHSHIYDIDKQTIPDSSDLSGYTGSTRSISPGSMQDDTTTPGRNWSRSDNRRSRQTNNTTLNRSTAANLAPHGYFPSPPPGPHPDGAVSSGRGYPGSSLHYAPTSSYVQTSGFYGQYTVPSQAPLNVAHPSSYGYPHAFHSPGGSGSNMGAREMQSNYLPLVQPGSHHPQYHYQSHPSDDTANANPSISPAAQSPSGYAPQVSSMAPTHSPSGPLSPAYMGPNHYAAVGYPPPPGNTLYAYPQQFAPSPPIYRPYAHLPYPQHPSSPREKTQGTWYYVSAPPQQQYNYDGSQYAVSPYAPPYPTLTNRPDGGPFVSEPSTASGSRDPPQSLPPTDKSSHTPQPTPGTSSVTSLLSPSRPASVGSKHVARREWHPRPPPHRSPWVMWAGNVPSDATQEELWTFFSNSPGTVTSSDADSVGGLVSIFLIARSNCAFINYASESSLNNAIEVFNGQRLRPNDPQCPMLVCKIRRSTDDLKSGVGGQRGIGLHKQWVKEQNKLHKQIKTQPESDDASLSHGAPDPVADDLGTFSVSSPPKRPELSSSSESYASTTSSLLGEHFPTRYFILKSLSEHDLELSVQSGLWATQKHNELVLDRAFRTASSVFLIFSVNKSGEFYGYARMAGPIRQGEGSVSWTSRSNTQSSSSSISPSAIRPPPPMSVSEYRLLSATSGPMYQSPDPLADGSPAQPLHDSDAEPKLEHHQSAPAQLGGPDASLNRRTPSLKLSFDQHQRRRQTHAPRPGFHLDPKAPFRAMRGRPAPPEDGDNSLEPVGEAREEREEGLTKPSPTWGDCFKVEWLERRKVQFHRTRHLRNAWNKGREIKVSRDGTELESGVGKRLLEEWGTLADS